jgi:drug/metabolite transporter (DMT)-like permease
LGIAVADTLFFMCLNRLGASRQAIVNTAYSPPIILLSVLFLGERLSVTQVLGVCLILMAVVTVGRENSGASDDVRGRRLSGVLLGVGACLAQAISVVMIKPRMGEWPVLWMTCWRMAGGVVAMLLLWPLFPKTQRSLAALADRRCWPTVLAGTLVGTYLSLLLWMGGFKYTQASVAAALNQTATLFTFILAVWILREPVTRRALMGLALGLLGVIIMGVASI